MIPLKIEQIAIATNTPESKLSMLSAVYGLDLTEWVRDTVVTEGRVVLKNSQEEFVRTTADLYFNYDMITGVEFELLSYREGLNWLEGYEGISHYGCHVDNMVEAVRQVKAKTGWEIVQDVKTISHTNPYLIEKKRKYHYVIFGARENIGADFKLIQRIEE